MTVAVDLAHRVAVVTGGTRGIGLATAGALALAGATVVLTGRDESAAKRSAAGLADSLSMSDGRITGVALDVTDDAAVGAVIRGVAREHGRLDVAVANAGMLEDGMIGMIRAESVDRVLATNVAGTMHTVQAAARAMMRHRRGSIVVLGSIVGRYGAAGQTVYAAAKAAVGNIAKSAAKELGRYGIRVNAVAPGVVRTQLTEHLGADALDALAGDTPLGRLGEPADVAGVIRFLASDDASFVTGQIIGVDGGLVV